MAQVYYGTDLKLERPVAVKVMDARYRGKAEQARRFIKEARLMAQWKHENIVQIFSADNEADLYYYVMEYVDGEDLASIMSSYAANGELMPFSDVIRIGRAIASALDYAHSQQIIHRDVKPSNVLVAKDGRVMLSDFGLALDLQDGSQGEVFGTAHYISPEQARRSADAIPQSDLYSFGVILYEILTGVVPFHDPSPTSVALQHITEPPPPPHSINAELSVQTEAVLLKALEKEPDKRYQSGSELMDALDAALSAVASSALTPLPPLPINVPTVRRMTISHNTVDQVVAGSSHPESEPTVRAAEAGKPEVEPTIRSVGTIQRELGPRASRSNSSRWWVVGVVAFLLLAAILFGALFRDQLFRNLPSEVARLTSTATQSVMTATALPSATVPPSVTASSSATEAAAPPLQATSTPAPILLPTSTSTPVPPTLAPSPTALPTERYPEGFLFRMVYDYDSFYILNLSDVMRTASGFSFELRDGQGNVLKSFGGWLWDANFPMLYPYRCMGIVIDNGFGDRLPSECAKVNSSMLEFPRDDPAIFWIASETSAQFIVLWKGEEAGRCNTRAGVCELRVP